MWWLAVPGRAVISVLCAPAATESFNTSLLICLTISGHFTHTTNLQSHKKWNWLKIISGWISDHFFDFTNAFDGVSHNIFWHIPGYLEVWCEVFIALCNVSRCWTVSHHQGVWAITDWVDYVEGTIRTCRAIHPIRHTGNNCDDCDHVIWGHLHIE